MADASDAYLTPLEQERNEFGYEIEQVRDRSLRIIRRTRISLESDTDTCVFFVHGGGGRACQFKEQIKSLQETADVVGIDFLGHGDSPAPDNPDLYTADEHLKDLIAIFKKYKKERNIIVAHCYGALHTVRLLKHMSDEDALSDVSGVALIALGNRCPLPGSWLLHLPVTVMEWLRPLARSRSNATIFSPHTDPNLIAFENAISDNNRMYVMKVLGADCSDAHRWEVWLQEAKEVIVDKKVPVVIVAGENDGVYPPDTCRELSNRFELPSDCFHVVSEVGHLVMLEQPNVVTGIVKELLRKVSQ